MSKLPKLLELCEELNAEDFKTNCSYYGAHGGFYSATVETGIHDPAACEKCNPIPRHYIALAETISIETIDKSIADLTALHEEWRKEHPLEEK
jgi:hypothetical protein